MSALLGIIITRRADADELAIYQYISETFGAIYADKFRKRLSDLFQTLAKQPFMGRPAKQDSSVRVLMMSRQNKILYKLTETQIIILRILNTRTHLSGKF